jgi:hypothetical protein
MLGGAWSTIEGPVNPRARANSLAAVVKCKGGGRLCPKGPQ